MKISAALTHTYDFACHSAACRPPTSGGTGGSSSGGRKARVRGGKPSAEAAHYQSKGKFVPGETPIADTTRIKGGAVHMNGKQVTGPIRKTPSGYAATMRGSEHGRYDLKKKSRVQSVVIGQTKTQVMRAAQEAVMMKNG